jgi:hypothetical protein
VTDNSKRTGAAIEAHYEFLACLVPTIEKFPRSHKFTIGDRIETIALDVLEALIKATYTRERTQRDRKDFVAPHESGAGTFRQIAALHHFGRKRGAADKQRPSARYSSVAIDPKRSFVCP